MVNRLRIIYQIDRVTDMLIQHEDQHEELLKSDYPNQDGGINQMFDLLGFGARFG